MVEVYNDGELPGTRLHLTPLAELERIAAGDVAFRSVRLARELLDTRATLDAERGVRARLCETLAHAVAALRGEARTVEQARQKCEAAARESLQTILPQWVR